MDTQPTNSSKSLFPQLEALGEEYLVKKAPFQLPASVKEFIVKYGPYITLVLMLLALPVILAAIGLSAVFLPAAAAGGLGAFAIVGLVLGLGVLALEAVALPGLFKRSKVGWNFVFYAVLLTALIDLLELDIVSLILGTLISLYFLFQIRSYYK